MSSVSPRNENLQILVVVHDENVRGEAARALQEAGYGVFQARDGAEGLLLFHRHQPDLLLIDPALPQIDGFHVCRRIRKLGNGLQDVPIMFMLAQDDEPALVRAFDVGGSDFIRKPVHVPTLLHRIRYVIRSHQRIQNAGQRERRLENAERIAKLGSWEWDSRTGVFSVSREYNRILGFEENFSPSFADVASVLTADDRRSTNEAYTDCVRNKTAKIVTEHTVQTGDGMRKRLRQEAEFNWRPDDTYLATGTLQDISEETAAKEKMLRLAYHDALTLLPNRTFLKAHLEYALNEARQRGKALALILLDLDLFTRVNTSLGTEAGDNVLMQLSLRLHDALNSPQCTELIHAAIDSHALPTPAHDVLARLEGDQFVILRHDFGNLDNLVRLLQKIVNRLSMPFHYKGVDIVLTASIGVALYPVNGNQGEALLRNADAAMRYSKQQGRNQFLFYTNEVDTRARERLALETDLRHALAHGKFELYYQPKVHLRLREVRSVEALIRWYHPEKGLISPALFIPMAEELGLIGELGNWLINEACRQTKEWNLEGIAPIRTAINVSALQLRSANFVAQVRQALERHRLLPGQLEIEITESVLADDSVQTVRTIEGLRSLGVKVALDDFGTGYSSLSYLTRFPFTALKIDRGFIKDCVRNPQSAAVVHTIIQLCKNLNLEVVAEGVEFHEELKFLQDHRCDMVQGYLFSNALDAGALLAFLHRKPWLEYLDFLGESY